MTQDEKDRIDHLIDVLTAYKEDKIIEVRYKGPNKDISKEWYNPIEIDGQPDLFESFSWDMYDYRIKPDRKYVDLDLPSGILWATENEKGFYSFDEANKKFGENMPSKDNFEELVRECYNKWDEERKGIEFLSPYNGATIFFPASGYRPRGINSINFIGNCGYLWSNSLSNTYGYVLHFNNNSVYPSGISFLALAIPCAV